MSNTVPKAPLVTKDNFGAGIGIRVMNIRQIALYEPVESDKAGKMRGRFDDTIVHACNLVPGYLRYWWLLKRGSDTKRFLTSIWDDVTVGSKIKVGFAKPAIRNGGITGSFRMSIPEALRTLKVVIGCPPLRRDNAFLPTRMLTPSSTLILVVPFDHSAAQKYHFE